MQEEPMVLILDGNSADLAHAQRKIGLFRGEKNPICNCSRSNRMHATDKIIEIAPYVRTCFQVTIQYKYHGGTLESTIKVTSSQKIKIVKIVNFFHASKY